MSELPKSWTEVSLGDLITAARAQRAEDAKLPILSMTRHEGLVDQEKRFGKRIASADTATYKVVRRGQLVVSFPINEGVIGFQEIYDEAIVSPAYKVWDVRDETILDRRYLHLYLRSPRALHYYAAKENGSTARRRSLPNESLLALPVPLPPLEEQRRIATILDQATGIQDAAGRYSQILRAHRRTAFLKVLDDTPISHLPVEAVSAAVIDCPHSTPRWRESGVTCLRTANLGYGEWNWDDHRFVDEAQHTERTKRAELLPGDIVLSREGTVGVMAMVSPGMRASLGQRLVQVRPSDEINREYLMEALMHELHPTRVEHRMIGATAKRINVKALKQLLLPIPPRDVQDRFGSIAMKIRESQKQAEKRLAHVTTLTRSLQSRAFRGEL